MLLQTSDVKIKKISQKGNEGVFEFSPLPAGFGRTLGNSLRRILISSLTGSAVTQIKIPGVSHQFTTVPGVKEDVVDLTLNFKKIVAKVHSENPVVGNISKKGKGKITAGDIEISSDAEIINKDLVIANLADAKSKFEAEVTISPGVGYTPVEDMETSKVGVVLIDALFSPVLHVSYEVEQTRKGAVTGLDKLVITVKTDGSISPEDAVIESATLLRNFFSRFARGPDPEELEEEEEEVTDTVSLTEDIYIDDLALPTRTVNALRNANIETLNQVSKLSEEELADIKNLGDKSVKEINKLLIKEGLR